jgi:hypothetical protein
MRSALVRVAPDSRPFQSLLVQKSATALGCRTLVRSRKGQLQIGLHVSTSHAPLYIDENPYNSDQGNCLDYTKTPANNLHPGDVNFKRLLAMYINGGTDYNDNDDYLKNNDDLGQQRGRNLRRQFDRRFHRGKSKSFPRRVILKRCLYV